MAVSVLVLQHCAAAVSPKRDAKLALTVPNAPRAAAKRLNHQLCINSRTCDRDGNMDSDGDMNLMGMAGESEQDVVICGHGVRMVFLFHGLNTATSTF